MRKKSLTWKNEASYGDDPPSPNHDSRVSHVTLPGPSHITGEASGDPFRPILGTVQRSKFRSVKSTHPRYTHRAAPRTQVQGVWIWYIYKDQMINWGHFGYHTYGSLEQTSLWRSWLFHNWLLAITIHLSAGIYPTNSQLSPSTRANLRDQHIIQICFRGW